MATSRSLQDQHQAAEHAADTEAMAVPFIRSLFSNQAQNYQSVSQVERGSPQSPTYSNKRHDDKDAQSQDSTCRPRINPRIIADATIGLSDGLTVPFALTAGLSALGDTNVVIYGGLAELIAGGISMGLGGYLGAKSEYEAYNAALTETKEIVAARDEQVITQMVQTTFDRYNLPPATLDSMTTNLLAQPEELVDFLMRFHHNLADTDYTPTRALICGATISGGYFVGGIIPLLPYLFFQHIQQAFITSIGVMALALFVFGWLKTSLVGETDRWACFKNAVQMTFLGGVAAVAAVECVKFLGG
jgi:VIT1/CCC1 family predicted Fe2+/Mn2+ transporter